MTTSRDLHWKKYQVGDQHGAVTLTVLETRLWPEAYEATEEGDDRPYALVTVSEGKLKYNVTVRDGPSLAGECLETVLGGALTIYKIYKQLKR